METKAKSPPSKRSAEDKREITIGSIVCRKYLLLEKIGEGSFGRIYLSKNTENNEKYAVKVEIKNTKLSDSLLKEAKILYDLKAERGFPRMYYFIKDDKYSIMVMSLLGKDLDKLFKSCNKKLSLKTVLLIADQMVSRLEYLHTKGFVHRDIKPENFLIGINENKETIYLSDMGLAKRYWDEKAGHIPYNEKAGQVGTARYTSIYSHLGLEQSRRDDLESLGYLLVYLHTGTLPWMHLPAKTREEKLKRIADVKMRTPVDVLCKDLPQEFLQYFQYVKSLSFMATPNYNYLKRLFRTLLMRIKHNGNLHFDWDKPALPPATGPLLKIEPRKDESRTSPMKKDDFLIVVDKQSREDEGKPPASGNRATSRQLYTAEKQASIQDHKWSSTIVTVTSPRETTGEQPFLGLNDIKRKHHEEMGGHNSTNKTKLTETSLSSKILLVDEVGARAEQNQKEELDEFSRAYHGKEHGQQIHVENNLEKLKDERRKNKLDMYIKIKTAQNPVWEKDEEDENVSESYMNEFLRAQHVSELIKSFRKDVIISKKRLNFSH